MEKIKNRIDLRFLSETLAIQSCSKDDNEMLTYIKNKLALINVTVEEDGYGNIYVTKGVANDYPCLIAHIDTVHSIVDSFSVFKDGDLLFAFNSEKGKQCGIGGDDKVGIYILLQALLDIPIMKAVFFRDEEIGALGSSYSINNHKSWYENCNYIIEPDRRDFYDLVTNSGGIEITSKEFIEETLEIAEKFGYKEAIGITSDVDKLAGRGVGISCINISCGYLNPHSASEVVSIDGVNAAYNYIYTVLSEFPHRKFPHTPPPRPVYQWKRDSSYYNTMFKEKQKLGTEQLELFGPHQLSEVYGYQTPLEHDQFILTGETKNKTKLYKYIGIKAIPFTVDVGCETCKEPHTLFYMPYEGRIFCTKCNNFASNEEDLNLFKYLEIDDTETTFVFSVYADSWMDKSNSKWDDILKCWVPDDMPF